MAVKAVLELTAVQNPGEITTTEIAAQMGLSQGGIFRHFSSKDLPANNPTQQKQA